MIKAKGKELFLDNLLEKMTKVSTNFRNSPK